MRGIAAPHPEDSQNPQFQGEGDDQIGAGLTEQPATADEQKMYDALVEPMLGIVHGEKTAQKMVDALKSGLSIADLTYQVGMVVVGEIEKQGKRVPDDILQMAAEDVVEDLVEIAVSIGIVPDDQEAIEQAYIDGLMGAIDKYGAKARQEGKITAESGAKHIDEMTALGGFSKNKTASAVQQATQGA